MGQLHVPGGRTYPNSDTGSAKSALKSPEGLVILPITLCNEAPAAGAAKRWAAVTPTNRPPVPHLLGRSTTSPGKYYPFIHLIASGTGSTTTFVSTTNAHLAGVVVGDEVNVYDITGTVWATEQTVSAISADGLTITVDTSFGLTPAINDILVVNHTLGIYDATNMVVLWEPYSTDITADEDITVLAAFAGHFVKGAFPTFCTNTTVFDITKMQRLSFYVPQV